jgi:hypothetical protein
MYLSFIFAYYEIIVFTRNPKKINLISKSKIVQLDFSNFLKTKRQEEKADQLAVSALRQVEEANAKLTRSGTLLQLQVPTGPLSPTVRLAWQEDVGRNSNDLQARNATSTIIQVSNNSQASPNSSREQPIKIARYSCVFGISPALVMIGNVYLNNNPPHGTSASVLITYGIIVPLVIIVRSEKIRQFAKDLFKKNCGMLYRS